MPYTIRFSDPSKQSIQIPDMPPGINIIDTSLSLVGRGYPNYGQKISQNFVNLLENFANVLPPENPIEGQLWYDTSDPNNKILRINDGTGTQGRWPSVNGIYQQSEDPKNTIVGLKVGDIWVDTVANQLKIYNSNDWTTVGPIVATGGEKTGVEVAYLEDISPIPISFPVTLIWVSGQIIAIVSRDTFVPKIVINGFSTIRPGINLSSNFASIFNGTALTSQNLLINGQNFSADKFLRKDSTTVGNEVITGNLLWQLPASESGWQKRDGIVILRGTSISTPEYLQIVKLGNDAHYINNTPGGNIIFRAQPSITSGLPQTLVSMLTLGAQSAAINTATNAAYTLDVYGTTRISSTLTIITSSSQAINLLNGGINVAKNVNVGTNLFVNGVTTASDVLYIGSNILSNTSTSNIGSITNPINKIYANVVGTGTNTFFYGQFKGPADRLAVSTQFKLQGQVTATSFTFGGIGGKSVQSISLDNPLSNGTYTTTATLVFSEPDLVGGIKARANITVNTTTLRITSVELIDAGNGYINVPTVTIHPATTQTTATFTISLTESNQGATFNAQLTPRAITSQTSISTATTSTLLLMAENNNLFKINKKDFLKDVSFTGMIVPYATNVAPEGWLLCDGTGSLSSATYAALYNVIGFTYGGSTAVGFSVPDLRYVTTATGNIPISYIIKT